MTAVAEMKKQLSLASRRGGKNESTEEKTKKSVRFDEDRNETHPVPHLRDIPKKTARKLWMDEAEYKDMVKSYQRTLRMMQNGELPHDDPSARGLECRVREAAQARTARRQKAYHHVLDEQDKQWDRQPDSLVCKYDFESTKRVYAKYTSKSAKEALARAKQDEKDAMAIYGCEILSLHKKLQKKTVSIFGSSSKSSSSVAVEKKSVLRDQVNLARSGSSCRAA